MTFSKVDGGAGSPSFLAFDLFCGAGGTTRGLIDAGGYVFAGIDNDGACRKTYRTNNKNLFWPHEAPDFLEHDLLPCADTGNDGQEYTIERLDTILSYLRMRWPGLPLVVSTTPPCQPFTRLGRLARSKEREREHQLETTLLMRSLNFVRWFLPDVVFSENVPGIYNSAYGGVWTEFATRLQEMGYIVGHRRICASKFGVPQYRRRAILVAIRRPAILEEFRDLEALQLPESDPHAKTKTVADAIGHLPPLQAGEFDPDIPNHRARALSRTNRKRLKAALPGEQNTVLADTAYGDLSLACHGKLRKRSSGRSGFTDVYMRMVPDRPGPTITTKCDSISNGRFGHYDVEQVRAISLREAALLQSFPEDYVFYPETAATAVARMIGNAVPPPLACFFAQWAVEKLDYERIGRVRTA